MLDLFIISICGMLSSPILWALAFGVIVALGFDFYDWLNQEK